MSHPLTLLRILRRVRDRVPAHIRVSATILGEGRITLGCLHRAGNVAGSIILNSYGEPNLVP